MADPERMVLDPVTAREQRPGRLDDFCTGIENPARFAFGEISNGQNVIDAYPATARFLSLVKEAIPLSADPPEIQMYHNAAEAPYPGRNNPFFQNRGATVVITVDRDDRWPEA